MKYISLFCFIIISLFIALGSISTKTPSVVEASSFLRIHIRANSNEVGDQVVKYAIKNKVVEYVTPLLVTCTNKEEVINVIKLHKQQIEKISNEILIKHMLMYQTNMSVKKEYFPTRMYNDVLLDAGMYDAIIVELGEAKGNNWWCVVYPPLCFINQTGNANIVYKSKILEVIEKFFK